MLLLETMLAPDPLMTCIVPFTTKRKPQVSADNVPQQEVSAPAAGTALALEALKRALSLDNRSRDSLVSAALSVGLVQLLLQRLDWRQKQAGEATSEVNLQPSRFAYFPSVISGYIRCCAEPQEEGHVH